MQEFEQFLLFLNKQHGPKLPPHHICINCVFDYILNSGLYNTNIYTKCCYSVCLFQPSVRLSMKLNIPSLQYCWIFLPFHACCQSIFICCKICCKFLYTVPSIVLLSLFQFACQRIISIRLFASYYLPLALAVVRPFGNCF